MCPREIKKLASKAKADAGQRSYLFEAWLSSSENWHKSALLSRLRSKKSSTARGFRKWMLRQEMVDKWGDEVADDMIEAKTPCEEKSMTEIRDWPECPTGKIKQYLCLFEDSAEDVDQTELEMVLEANALDSSSSSSSKKKKRSKKKSKNTRKARSRPRAQARRSRKAKVRGKTSTRKAKALMPRWGAACGNYRFSWRL